MNQRRQTIAVLSEFLEAMEDGNVWLAYKIQQVNNDIIKGETSDDAVSFAKNELSRLRGSW